MQLRRIGVECREQAAERGEGEVLEARVGGVEDLDREGLGESGGPLARDARTINRETRGDSLKRLALQETELLACDRRPGGEET